MAGNPTITSTIDLIQQKADGASSAVAQLDTYCLQDTTGRTPLNTAIEVDNREIIELIVKSDDAVNFYPNIDEDLIDPVRHYVADSISEDQVGSTEKNLARNYGPRMCFQRTPLHQACRFANRGAISMLVSKTADVNAKDILGLTPLDLAIEFGGTEVIQKFLDACEEFTRELSVNDLTLRMVCKNADLYERVIQQGKLDKKAKRFAFNLSAALLDKVAMENLLQAGLNIKDTFGPETSPILEVCTSRVLSDYKHPEAPRLAGQYVAATGSGVSSIHIDNDAIANAESLEDIQALFQNATNEAEDEKKKQTSYSLSDEEREDLLRKRIELIAYLAERGVDADMIRRKQPYRFVSGIVSMDSPEMLQALLNIGLTLGPEDDDSSELIFALTTRSFSVIDPLIQLGHDWTGKEYNHPELMREYRNWKKENSASVVQLDLSGRKPVVAAPETTVRAIRNTEWTWELPGESMLLAATVPEQITRNTPTTIRVTHNNVYGPCDIVKLFVRVGDPRKPTPFDELGSDDDWHSMTLVEDLLSIDGEDVDRRSISEPLYGETPWEGTYESELVFKKGKHSIEIRLVSNEEGMSGVFSDWIVKVA